MWFHSKDSGYLLKVVCCNNILRVMATNCVHLWESSFERDRIIQIFKSENMSFEGANWAILKKVMDLLSPDAKDTHHDITRCNNSINITSTAKVSDFSISITLNLNLSTAEKFYEEFTADLIYIVSYLTDREKKLIEVIASKDAELEEYQEQGIAIKRRGVITAPFKDTTSDSFSISSKKPIENPALLLGQTLLSKLPIGTLSPTTVKTESFTMDELTEPNMNDFTSAESIGNTSLQEGPQVKTDTHDKPPDIKKKKITQNSFKLRL